MRVLLALDNSKSSQAALRAIPAEMRTKGIQVRILHVVEEILTYISSEMMPHFVRQAADIEEERRKEARQLVRRAAVALRKSGFEVSEAVDFGDPKEKILDHAARWHADLIILGSHGFRGLSRFLMGSVSEAVARHARCSVQIVRIQPARKRKARR